MDDQRATGPSEEHRPSPPGPPVGRSAVVAIGVVMALLVGIVGGFVAAKVLGDEGDDEVSADIRDAVPDTNLPVDAVPAGDAAAPDEDDVELADDVVVVSGQGGDAVRSVSDDGATLVLDAGADGVADLEEGAVLLLTGITAGRVTAVDDVDDGVEVTLEPVGLGDVIEDADLTWEPEPVDLADAVLTVYEPDDETLTEQALGGTGSGSTPPEAVPASAPLGDVQLASLLAPGSPGRASFALPVQAGEGDGDGGDGAGGAPTPRQVTGDVGDWHYQASATTSGDAITFDILLTKDADGVRTAVDVHGEVRGVSLGGSLDVSSGRVGELNIDTPNLSGSADVTGIIAVGPEGGNLQVASFEVPMAVQVPFPVYGIPFTVGIEAKIQVDPEITTADAAVTGRFRADYSGSAGLSVSGTSLSTSGAATPNLEDPLEWVGGVSIAPASLIITVLFPKVSIGLGMSTARASAYLMVSYSFAPTISGVTNVTPCIAQPMSMVIKAGIDAELLGHEVDVASAEIARRDAAPFYPEIKACEI